MFTEPPCHASGLYAIDWAENFVHWLAWRSWMHDAFGKTCFPQRLTMNFSWPPTSGEGAQTAADTIRTAREALSREGGRHTGKLLALPDVIVPWNPWPTTLRADVSECERQRRAAWGYAFTEAPEYPWVPRMGFRWSPPMHREPVLPTLKPKTRFVPRYVPGRDDGPPEQRLDDRPVSDELRAAAAKLRERVA